MPTDNLQLPPQAVEAEMAVLGSMLIENFAVERALEVLHSEDVFYKDSHKKIFQAVRNLYERHAKADLVTVSEELRTLRWLADVGGTSYLKELTDKVSTAAHVEHYARIVLEKSVLRELIRTSTEIVSQCYAEEKEVDKLLDDAQASVLQIAQKKTAKTFSDAKELAHEVIDQLERLSKHRDEVRGVPSGFAKLDLMTSGFQKGDLILLAARPGQGKTSLALNVAANAVLRAKVPVPTAFFSLEMSKQDIMMRLMASEAGINVFKVRTAHFPKDRWAELTSAGWRISEAPLFIDDSSSLTVLQVRTRARRLHHELGQKGKALGLIIIDYLQLMQGGVRRSDGRQQEVAEISRNLKQLARDLKVPVIALSQLSRKTEEKGRADARPQLSDLRESGALEQDADIVAMIYREGYYKRDDPTVQNKAELILAKHRNGPVGSVPLVFRHELTRFENAAEGEEQGAEEQAQVEE
ncbi:MAG TPA: replicative DNA helicase [Elusimicrobia bacterium]|nr:replicative DNA helicase [Elusimicrobiota bacterium]